MREEVEKRIPEIKNNSQELNDILTKVISAYSKDLDDIMLGIDNDILKTNNPAIYTIEHYFLSLSSYLYFMCEKVEQLGIYDSISKAKAQEVYNNSYLNHQYESTDSKKKLTVAELTALSETDAIYDKTLNDLYSKAYKVVKNKISSAETMVNTLSKILSHRIQEAQLTTSQTARQILNEGEVF